MRQKFWPLNSRNLCRKMIHNCEICFNAKPSTHQQFIGNLPPERITQTFEFCYEGVGFLGNFMTQFPKKRKGKFNKVCVCFFTCVITMACHLEIVTDLLSNAFIVVQKRFTSRHRKYASTFTDNATNFTGSNTQLKRLQGLVKNSSEIFF